LKRATSLVGTIFKWKVEQPLSIFQVPHQSGLHGNTFDQDYFLSFENLSKLSRPILFKSLLEQFTFCPQNKQKWGAALMGGIRRLNDTYYQLIKKQIQ